MNQRLKSDPKRTSDGFRPFALHERHISFLRQFLKTLLDNIRIDVECGTVSHLAIKRIVLPTLLNGPQLNPCCALWIEHPPFSQCTT